MPKIEFIKLKRPEKARILSELAETYYLKGERVLVMVQDDNQGVTLDQFMWTWNKGSFVPHVYDNGAVECLDEPVVIATREDNPNGAQVLIMGSPCQVEFIRQFRQVIDFAETYDDALLQASRERFRLYREVGFAPELR